MLSRRRRSRPRSIDGASGPVLSFDGEPSTATVACARCGVEHDSVTGFVLRDGDAYAIYFADWHPGASEAYLDVILGSFEASADPNHVTFGCRVGHVPAQAEPACSLTAAASCRSDGPLFGRKLDRDAALAHGRLAEFWTVVDWLILNDPMLHANVFHMPPRMP